MNDTVGLECCHHDGGLEAVLGKVSAGMGSETDAEGSLSADQKKEPELLTHLEMKMDELSDLLVQQCRSFANFRGVIQHSKAAMEQSTHSHHQLFTDLVNKITAQWTFKKFNLSATKTQSDPNNRAKCLMDAIEVKQAMYPPNQENRELTNFLESKELRECVMTALRDRGAQELPELRRAVRDAFAELEESAWEVSRRLSRATQRLRTLVLAANAPVSAADMEEVLERQLELWQQQRQPAAAGGERRAEPPALPPLPPAEELSSIDHLMLRAEISRLLRGGHEAAAFAAALSARDLRLVRAACRAAPPARAHTLPAPLRLALAQQLATDLLPHTALHCRYLEEIIISLNVYNPATSAHLPLVVGEIRKHLTGFLRLYPNHVASRRITLIVMAADNLLKYCN